MGTDQYNRWERAKGSKDAARLNTLMGKPDEQAESGARSSIPMPPLDRGGHESTWDARGAMTLESYQRLRRGYERGINPEALERMDGHRESARPASDPTASYDDRRVYEDGPYEPVYSEEPEFEEVTKRRRATARSRRIGPFAVLLILLVGIVGGLLLYAGGVEYIGDLFRGGTPSSDEDLTLVTERPHEEPVVDPTAALAPGEEMEMADSESAEGALEDLSASKEGAGKTEEPATSAEQAQREAAERARTERNEAEQIRRDLAAAEAARTRTDDPPKKTPAKSAEPAASTASTQTTATAAAPKETSTPKVTPVNTEASGGKRFAVQVRATPDKAEADRIARSLRAKGGADVHIVATEKNGETVYRVRFGSFGSEAEGKAKAGEMGYSNVWVVGQ